MSKRVLWVWVGMAGALAACSSTTSSTKPGGGGSSATVDQACTQLSGALCDKIAMCLPIILQVLYGDAATCKTRVNLACPSLATGNGSTTKPSDLDTCSQAYAALNCADLLGSAPAACDFHGTLMAGAACANGSQCSGANGYCNTTGQTSQACGVCSTRAPAGGSCSSTADCQSGLKCGQGTGTTTGACVTPAAAGAACDGPHPCGGTLGCVNGTCSQPLGPGVACSPTYQNCDGSQGLYCDAAASVCKAYKTASPGATCGISTVDRTYTACTGGSTCKMASASLAGTCEAPAADGTTCDLVNGPSCQSPAACTNGVCKIPDPAACK